MVFLGWNVYISAVGIEALVVAVSGLLLVFALLSFPMAMHFGVRDGVGITACVAIITGVSVVPVMVAGLVISGDICIFEMQCGV